MTGRRTASLHVAQHGRPDSSAVHQLVGLEVLESVNGDARRGRLRSWLSRRLLIIVVAFVIMASDILGYFAGKIIGGPKFWPKVSPKKTWSGTIAGWIGAGLVALFYVANGHASGELIGISIAIAIAGQLGDVAESALKRHVGVKDSSNILPGHGGMFDRFDAMLGASLFLLLVGQLIGFPPVPA